MKKIALAASAALVLSVALSACDRQPQQVTYVQPSQPIAAAPVQVVQPVQVVAAPVVVQPSAGDVAAAAMLGVAVGSMYSYGGHYYAHDYRGYYYIDHGHRYYDPRPPYSVVHHNYNVTVSNAPAARAAAPQVVQPTKIAQPISARPQPSSINLVKAPAAAPTPAPAFRPQAARSFAPAPAARSTFRPTSARK